MLQQAHCPFKPPGVGVIVFIRAELGRIDEDGRDDDVVFLSGGTDEGSVSSWRAPMVVTSPMDFPSFLQRRTKSFSSPISWQIIIITASFPEKLLKAFLQRAGTKKSAFQNRMRPKWGSGYGK